MSQEIRFKKEKGQYVNRSRTVPSLKGHSGSSRTKLGFREGKS